MKHYSILHFSKFTIYSYQQVCIPGLHITLGVYLKLFKLFEFTCHKFDIEIADIFARKNYIVDSDFGDYVEIMTKVRTLELEVADLYQQIDDVNDQANWVAIQNGVVDQYDQIVANLQQEIEEKNKNITQLSNCKLDTGVGPCAASLDDTLKQLNVERQAYYGKSFIGNHCHKMLRVSNNHL